MFGMTKESTPPGFFYINCLCIHF